MRPVRRRSAPKYFANEIRKRGLLHARALKKRYPKGGVPEREYKGRAYWRRCLDDLEVAFGGVCAYACIRIHPVTGARTVDHFIPKSRDPLRAYSLEQLPLRLPADEHPEGRTRRVRPLPGAATVVSHEPRDGHAHPGAIAPEGDPRPDPRHHRTTAGQFPPNLLQFPNTESNSGYLRRCKALQREGHPARFPTELPEFFIRFLTDEGDLVVDIFSGSNTTGAAAESLGRTWLSIDERRDYAALSAVRFLDACDDETVRRALHEMEHGRPLDLQDLRRAAGADRQGSLAL